MPTAQLPQSLMLEFLRSTCEPVRLLDLSAEFLTQQRVPTEKLPSPFRIAIGRKQSKAGNAFYEYSQNSLPLPDGLSSWLRIEGVVIPMGRIRPSQTGHPTREGTARIVVGGILYVVTAVPGRGGSSERRPRCLIAGVTLTAAAETPFMRPIVGQHSADGRPTTGISMGSSGEALSNRRQ
jgi:hypothetical protein